MRIFLSGLFLVFSLAFANTASAEQPAELSPEKIDDIKSSCVSVQVVLQKIQYNDAATRVNRGQGYESLVSRMIIPMNGRVAINGLSSSAADLASITARYQHSFANFKNIYEDYDDVLTQALRIRCQEKPAEFYGLLLEAREQRANLFGNIATLAQIIEDYRQAVVKIKGEV